MDNVSNEKNQPADSNRRALHFDAGLARHSSTRAIVRGIRDAIARRARFLFRAFGVIIATVVLIPG
jgi:hypothetical protein